MFCVGLRQTLSRVALVAVLVCTLWAPGRASLGETVLATGFVNSTTLNLRPDPNTDRPPLGTLSYGDVVTVYGLYGVWCKVDVPAPQRASLAM